MNLCYFLVALAVCSSAQLLRGSSTSLQTEAGNVSSANEEMIGHGIRHRKRKRIKTGTGRQHFKRRNKHRNNAARRYLEKQLLVYNRTIALLGDEVEKILQGSQEGRKVDSWSSGEKNEVRSSWGGSPEAGRAWEAQAMNSPYGEPLRNALEKALNNLLLQLLHDSSSSESDLPTDHSPCRQWEDCKKKLEDVFLGPLPSCPCRYPSGIFYDNRIWDESHQRHFHWRDASGEGERLDVYKQGADYCIRSLLSHHSLTLSAQHCCYDKERKLITRGSGAGNPNYVSPDASSALHYKIDILPWRICKGDFTRYNKVRPPNNGNKCKVNPEEEEFQRQVERTTNF